MNGWRVVLFAGLTIWVCAALQQAVAQRLSILGAEPDFLLVALGSFAMVCERPAATFIGFCCGAVYGAIGFANITHYVISRTAAGFSAGWFKQFHLESNVLVMALTVAIITLFARLVLMFLAPPPLITPFLAATIRTAVYNGVLAVPMCLLVKRLMAASPGR